MDVITIFKAGSAIKAIAEYFQIIDSVSHNVKKLLHQSFNSAVQNLKYANNANGEVQKHYLYKAQDDFISSFNIEENENLISAYIGCAMCQHLLGDNENARITLSKIKDVKLSAKEIASSTVLDITTGNNYGMPTFESFISLHPFAMVFRGIKRSFGVLGPNEVSRKEAFEAYKRHAINAYKALNN